MKLPKRKIKMWNQVIFDIITKTNDTKAVTKLEFISQVLIQMKNQGPKKLKKKGSLLVLTCTVVSSELKKILIE